MVPSPLCEEANALLSALNPRFQGGYHPNIKEAW